VAQYHEIKKKLKSFSFTYSIDIWYEWEWDEDFLEEFLKLKGYFSLLKLEFGAWKYSKI
jgi:hypothetical protein